MKMVVLLSALMLSAGGLLAQGTLIFANSADSLVVWGEGGDGPPGMPVAAESGIRVGLYYYGDPYQEWPQLGFRLASTTPVVGTSWSGATNATLNGRFNALEIVVTGLAAGLSGTFQVRAWSGDFASYDLAVAGRARFLGVSAAFMNPSGGGFMEPAPLAGFTGMTVGLVPEPSTGVMALWGLASPGLVRRGRQLPPLSSTASSAECIDL